MRSVLREGGYRIFEDGTVLGIRGKPLNPYKHPHGYFQVNLRDKRPLLHRLLAEAFIPNPENKPEVNHIDGDKSNFSLGNLEWCNRSENVIHAYSTGLTPSGSDHKRAKLSEDDVRDIRSSYKDNYRGWTTATARRYGVSNSTISRLVNSISHTHP